MKNYKFYINGMHCKACVALIESELHDVPGIKNIKVSLDSNDLELFADFGEQSNSEIAEKLTKILKPHGYFVSADSFYNKESNVPKKVNWSDFKVAIPVALVFIALFITLQKLGIVNLVTSSKVTYGTAFIVGIVASLSTCMAVVGGIVLSMSANFAKSGDKIRPQVLFHIGRLVSFFVLGGVIGTLGSVFQFGITGIFVLSFLVALILLVLGINLLDIFPSFKKLQPTLPTFIGKRVHSLKSINHTLTPLLIGIATFFLPCGFTQSMQIFSLTTGSFMSGALTMFFFALGTLPVLALLSFSFSGIHNKAKSGIFFKTAGLVVIFFGILNLINSLVSIGVIPPIFNF